MNSDICWAEMAQASHRGLVDLQKGFVVVRDRICRDGFLKCGRVGSPKDDLLHEDRRSLGALQGGWVGLVNTDGLHHLARKTSEMSLAADVLHL